MFMKIYLTSWNNTLLKGKHVNWLFLKENYILKNTKDLENQFNNFLLET